MIISTMLVCMVYGALNLEAKGPQIDTVDWFNSQKFAGAIGFSIYAYEGVGVIMPIQDITRDPEKYNNIVYAVVLTCGLYYMIFGNFCVISWGQELENNPLITA